MATSKKQDDGFKAAVASELPNSLLQTAIDWIRDNVNPDEVFDRETLKSFVKNTAFPDEVFDTEDLHKWAEQNGYMKEKEPAWVSDKFES